MKLFDDNLHLDFAIYVFNANNLMPTAPGFLFLLKDQHFC